MSYQLVELKDATAIAQFVSLQLLIGHKSNTSWTYIVYCNGFRLWICGWPESMTQNVDELHEDPNMNER